MGMQPADVHGGADFGEACCIQPPNWPSLSLAEMHESTCSMPLVLRSLFLRRRLEREEVPVGRPLTGLPDQAALDSSIRVGYYVQSFANEIAWK